MYNCKQCKIDKEASEFYTCKGNSSGVTGKCKECIKEYNRLNHSKVDGAYDRTYRGVLRVSYKTMKRHQKQRPHKDNTLPFSKEDFVIWMEESGYKEKYDQWESSGYVADIKPSVDRLDDFKGYSFDNMRLITWGENRQHQVNDILNGEGTSGLRCHPIGKYNNKGDLLHRYTSYSEVRRVEGYCIHSCVKQDRPCKKGFIWKRL